MDLLCEGLDGVQRKSEGRNAYEGPVLAIVDEKFREGHIPCKDKGWFLALWIFCKSKVDFHGEKARPDGVGHLRGKIHKVIGEVNLLDVDIEVCFPRVDKWFRCALDHIGGAIYLQRNRRLDVCFHVPRAIGQKGNDDV